MTVRKGISNALASYPSRSSGWPAGWRRSLRRLLAAGSLFASAWSVRGAPDLGELLLEPQSWSVSAADFLEERGELGFRAVDRQQMVMSTQREALRFLEMEVWEARVYFEGAAMRRVELSLYNKGDAGAKDRKSLEALAERIRHAIRDFLEDGGMAVAVAGERANYIVKRHQWVKSSPGVQLEWAYVLPHRSAGQAVPYSSEYIKVLLVPLKTAGGMRAISGGMAEARGVKSAREVRESVARSPEGDVVIEGVPMVDQGQKGYCAAASSERVLRYYGLEVDQHKVAQLANTAAEGGTTLDGMVSAIGKIGRQFQLDKRELIASGAGVSFERSDHAKLLKDYNAMARRKKAGQVDWQDYTTDHIVDLPSIWAAMDPEILLEARVGQRQAQAQFVRNVANYIDQGVPLLWSCLVGMYPEEVELGQSGVFGHVRLIIGYNNKTREIFYSDSWGPVHALKRLPLDQAWAMTKGLIVLKPRGVR